MFSFQVTLAQKSAAQQSMFIFAPSMWKLGEFESRSSLELQ
jgi:hypothetical protein